VPEWERPVLYLGRYLIYRGDLMRWRHSAEGEAQGVANGQEGGAIKNSGW